MGRVSPTTRPRLRVRLMTNVRFKCRLCVGLWLRAELKARLRINRFKI